MGAWVMDSVGWWYRNADGSYPTNISMVIDGRTYRFDGRGYMLPAGSWTVEPGTTCTARACGSHDLIEASTPDPVR